MRKFLLSALTVVSAAMLAVMPVCAEPADMGDGALFDAVFYAQNNPDVVKVYGTDAKLLYLHYTTFGKNEGRAPYAQAATVNTAANVNASGKERTTPDTQAQFDAVFYAKQYPDVAAVYGADPIALYNHYINNGYYEGRLGHAGALAYLPESKYAMRVLELINMHRKEEAMGELNYSFEMANAAMVRAKELKENYSSYRPNKKPYSTALPGWAEDKDHAEIIAKNYATPEDVVFWWYDFRHDGAEMRKEILNFKYTEGGAAYWVDPDTGTTYWVMEFGRRTHYTDKPGQ